MCQEGIGLVLPYMTKRIAKATPADLFRLLVAGVNHVLLSCVTTLPLHPMALRNASCSLSLVLTCAHIRSRRTQTWLTMQRLAAAL